MPSATTNKKYRQLSRAFPESPHRKVFDYRKIQCERNGPKNAISDAVIDLKTETIKTGSPHIRRIAKTQGGTPEEKIWKEEGICWTG